MPQRSKKDLIPKAIRAELDRRLGEGGFANSSALAEWLNDKGFEIGKIAIPHHGEQLEGRLDAVKRATEQARAIGQPSPDDEGAMNEAVIRLVQQVEMESPLDAASATVTPRS